VAWRDRAMSTDTFGSLRQQMLAEVAELTIYASARIGKAALAKPVMEAIAVRTQTWRAAAAGTIQRAPCRLLVAPAAPLHGDATRVR